MGFEEKRRGREGEKDREEITFLFNSVALFSLINWNICMLSMYGS